MKRVSIRLGASLVAGLVATPALAAQPAGDPAPASAPPAAPADAGAAPASTPAPEGPSAGAGVSVSADAGGANASGDAGANGGAAGGGKAAKKNTGKCQDDTSVKWIRRCRPERNMFELGIFGGVFFTGGTAHELFDPVRQLASLQDGDPGNEFWKPYRKVAPEIGARFAYFPLSFLGGEIEGGAMPTRILLDGQPADRAILFNFRAHLIGQLPFWRIAPFVLVGGGAIGTTGALGNDIDESTHFGVGVKAFLSHRAVLRLDLRNVVAARLRVDNGAVSYPEILLGLSVALNRKPKQAPPDKDSDGDGFLDNSDACPFEPGIAPDGCPERDRDGDGFMDSQDACPDVPGVAPDGCPLKDRDGDGFLDIVDKCPDDPGVEPDGCPIPDTDGDGILDPDDKCPQQPETRNGYMDEDGCPDEIPTQLAKFTGTIKGIYFDLDKDTIKPKSRPVLDRAVAVLKEFPTIRIEISGHTDSTGSVAYNKDLSGRRAASVKRYLVEHGIDTARIETRGAGPDEPVDTNKTAAGRAKNRRIEFTILVQ